MDELEKELKVCFLDEAQQLIEDAEQCFLDLENNKEDMSIIEKIFRLAHNLKGSSRAVGFTQVAEFTHVFESLLLKLKTKEFTADSAIVSLLLRCNDHLRGWVADLKANMDATKDSAELIQELQSAIAGGGAASQAGPSQASAPAEEAPSAPISFDAPTPAMDAPPPPAESGSWSEVPPASAFGDEAPPALQTPAAFEAPAAPAVMEVAAPAPVAAPAVEAAAPKAEPEKKADLKKSSTPPAAAEDESVRVSLRRLENLVNFVGELVILQTVLNQHRHQIQSPLLTRTVGQLAKITKDIQDISMSLRMVPLKQTFQKMQRIVRDTSKALKKEINFTLIGENTELDKTVVEQLGDPLVHLVRNAVDHGIESAEERVAAGKTAAGNITLAAYHKGGQIVLEVVDDGKGLDPVKLKKKAIEKGILRPEQNISDEEAIKLIFAAGFSTKEQVTEVSGRGVGMDVVKTNIEKVLHGEIQLTSAVGKGSMIRVSLPLTLAIIDGMVVKSAEERFVVPLGHVHESLQPKPEDVHTVTGLGEILSLRGEELPLHRLGSMLGRRVAKPRPAHECIAIVVRASSSPFSILVDDIIGQQQIVIKQLGAEVRHLKGITGGAILGDGRAALILDVTELAARGTSAGAPRAPAVA